MDKYEIEGDLADSYRGLVNSLLKKYGSVPCDYFTDESCKTVGPRISRSSEGLQCHHIDEDKAIMLSTPEWAIKNPFNYQKAERLVYCNIFEHLILHLKIMEEPRKKSANPGEVVGVGGAVNFIIPQLNDYYNGKIPIEEYRVKLFEPVSDNFEEYISILEEFLFSTMGDLRYRRSITKEKLSRGTDGKIVEKVYDRLKDLAV